MKIFDHCVIYTADDEEPDCMICVIIKIVNTIATDVVPLIGGFTMREQSEILKMSKLVRVLEKLGLKR